MKTTLFTQLFTVLLCTGFAFSAAAMDGGKKEKEKTNKTTIEAESCDGFRTQTQGGWGTKPKGNNPGSYLWANFSNAFPNGLAIGCNNKLKLTSASAVSDFLPSGGTASMLPTGTLVNPGGSYTNVLAAQLVAATLSVGFDTYDANFGSSSSNLKDLVLSSGALSGYSVEDVITEANNYIGGCGSSFSASTLNSALTGINESYVDGKSSGSFLICGFDVDADIANVSCNGGNDGFIGVYPSGGTAPYSYAWSNGTTTQNATSLVAGTYTVTVTAANGISVSETYAISEPAPLWLKLYSTDAQCGEGALGEIYAVAGGSSGFTYAWSTGATGSAINGLYAGTYSVTATDQNGCTVAGSETVSAAAPMSLSFTVINSTSIGNPNGKATAAVSGGSAPYSYQWSNGQSAQMATGLGFGYHSVTVTDLYGCSVIDSAFVNGPVFGKNGSENRTISSQHELRIYPNPLPKGSALTLSLGDVVTNQTITIEVYDLLGHLTHQSVETVSEGNNTLGIGALKNASKGTYLLRVTRDEQTSIHRIQVED